MRMRTFRFCVGLYWLAFHFFFFNDTATTEIYTLSLYDALPIWKRSPGRYSTFPVPGLPPARPRDRKSTRLNSSHLVISYAVFCLKKKTRHTGLTTRPSTTYTRDTLLLCAAGS